MKKLTFLFLTIFLALVCARASELSFENIPTVLKAKSASGINNRTGRETSSCFFSMQEREVFPHGTEFSIFVGADNPRDLISFEGPSFIIKLRPEQLPLHEGFVGRPTEQELLTYEDGILKYSFKAPSYRYEFASDIITVEIATDPKLDSISWAKGENYSRRYLLPDVRNQSIECRF